MAALETHRKSGVGSRSCGRGSLYSASSCAPRGAHGNAGAGHGPGRRAAAIPGPATQPPAPTPAAAVPAPDVVMVHPCTFHGSGRVGAGRTGEGAEGGSCDGGLRVGRAGRAFPRRGR